MILWLTLTSVIVPLTDGKLFLLSSRFFSANVFNEIERECLTSTKFNGKMKVDVVDYGANRTSY